MSTFINLCTETLGPQRRYASRFAIAIVTLAACLSTTALAGAEAIGEQPSTFSAIECECLQPSAIDQLAPNDAINRGIRASMTAGAATTMPHQGI